MRENTNISNIKAGEYNILMPQLVGKIMVAKSSKLVNLYNCMEGKKMYTPLLFCFQVHMNLLLAYMLFSTASC